MMPDLGRYAVEVLSAYAGTLSLIFALVAGSIWKSRRVQKALIEVEARRSKPQ